MTEKKDAEPQESTTDSEEEVAKKEELEELDPMGELEKKALEQENGTRRAPEDEESAGGVQVSKVSKLDENEEDTQEEAKV